jgi:hypothetical protein
MSGLDGQARLMYKYLTAETVWRPVLDANGERQVGWITSLFIYFINKK